MDVLISRASLEMTDQDLGQKGIRVISSSVTLLVNVRECDYFVNVPWGIICKNSVFLL